MKNCSYCGLANADDAIYCPGCGTEFKQELEVQEKQIVNAGATRRPPRPEAETVVLRTFSYEFPAQRALQALRDARIEGTVVTDDCGGAFLQLSRGDGFRLLVSAVHREAAEQVLAEIEREPAPAVENLASMDPAGQRPNPPAGPVSTNGILGVILGLMVGAIIVAGYNWKQNHASGDFDQDYNGDGRIDARETWKNGRLVRITRDMNGDARPDDWTYYQNGVVTRWEGDNNFDGKIDSWSTFDNRGLITQTKVDLDFDGKPDVIYSYASGLIKQANYMVSESGLVWKKAFFTNGVLREELIDLARDGTFDEKISYDVFGDETNREKLK